MSTKKVISMDLERYVNEMKRLGLCKEKKNDYACLCPICKENHKKQGDLNYNKLKLWIDKDFQYSQCWVCGTVFLADNQEISTHVKRLESSIDMSDWKLCKLGNDGYWTLDRFNEFDEFDQEGVDYLAKKRLYLYRDMYKLLKIRFKDHNPVVPFFYKGELIYYQMRIIDSNSKIKYYSPTIEHKPPYILEHGDNKNWVISEGTFDAIADRILFPNCSTMGVLGSDITPYQVAILRSYCPENIMIYMDKTELSYRIKDTIEKYINYAEITIHPSSGEDPEEALRLKLIENL